MWLPALTCCNIAERLLTTTPLKHYIIAVPACYPTKKEGEPGQRPQQDAQYIQATAMLCIVGPHFAWTWDSMGREAVGSVIAPTEVLIYFFWARRTRNSDHSSHVIHYVLYIIYDLPYTLYTIYSIPDSDPCGCMWSFRHIARSSYRCAWRGTHREGSCGSR